MIALAPDVQRRGIGTAIIHTVLCDAYARGRAVVLHVTEENVGSRRLYERLGFPTGRVMEDPATRTRKVEMMVAVLCSAH